MFFLPFLTPLWPNNCVISFDTYPNCAPIVSFLNFNSYSTETVKGNWSNVQGESQIVGPFSDGSSYCGLLIPDVSLTAFDLIYSSMKLQNLGTVLQCALNVLELDQASPALMQSLVWSWAPNEPSNIQIAAKFNKHQEKIHRKNYEPNLSNICGYLNGTDGRWYSIDCNSTILLPSVCRSSSIPSSTTDSLSISLSKSTWAAASCNASVFSFPFNGQDNYALLQMLRGGNAWINILVDANANIRSFHKSD